MNIEDCYMRTFTGLRVNPLALRPEDVVIRDIAHSLACYNRFGGHARVPYNIAQHSICVMLLVEHWNQKLRGTWEEHRIPQIALQALLHDASEAYLGDVTKWLKMTSVMDGYRSYESIAQAVIYETHSLPLEDLYDVKLADKFMVRYEASRLYDHYPILTAGYECPTRVESREFEDLFRNHFGQDWKVWNWQESEHRFIQEYDRLMFSRLEGAPQ